ncbi:acyl-CoA dehydrogenase family protein [Paludisphaera mucosa]|uniref:Acyl-CoA/acyl-ACP dehydrogenase n=1 Tax=Paludisphaera mucosa TaxID=3030827 RepID=A0ABT6F9U6_9BACT|nr:acyl-CoA dehydrogenase family protein [Paludisphaera mucosa]MDG3004366.1 acyl-CoA/acyl-ACP dehydrogenase [Paludisphaera mucosa]
MSGVPLVEQAAAIASQFLSPRADQADMATGPPVEQIRRLAEAGLLGLTTPPQYGGEGAAPSVVRDCLAAVASGCGVTAFIYYQHIVGCRHLASCSNAPLKDRLMPDLSAGRRFCSLAFSHLRRPGPPPLRVLAEGDAWIFDGTAPWMTGWGFADDVLLAGVLPDGRSAWALVPLSERGDLQASPPARLCAMNASATVSLECRALRVEPERQVKTMTPAELAADTDRANIFFTALSLGAARAAVGSMRSGRCDDLIADAADALEREVESMRAAVDRWDDPATPADERGDATALRARCIDLGVRASNAAVVVGGGAANGLGHPAQRLFREAMVYSLIAQTRDLRSANLDLLLRSDKRVSK